MPLDNQQFQQMFMMMFMKMMEKESGTQGENWAEGGKDAMDGLRSMRAMSRARAIHKRMMANPAGVIDEYHDSWEQLLDGSDKCWTWRDAAKTVAWRHYRSQHRVFLILGAIDRLQGQGKHEAAHLLTIQAMKSVHQMVLDGHWTTSWKFVESWVSDPYRAKTNAASELELEAALGSVKVEEEVVKRARQVSQWPAVEEHANDKKDTKGKGNGGGKKGE